MSWKAENPRHPTSTSPQGIYRDRILPARGREIDLGWRIPLEGSQIDYLDAVGEVAAEPRAHLRVTVTLGPGVPPLAGGDESYPLREFGLFGRLAGEDTMIDYVRHPVIHKRADDTLVRNIRLVF